MKKFSLFSIFLYFIQLIINVKVDLKGWNHLSKIFSKNCIQIKKGYILFVNDKNFISSDNLQINKYFKNLAGPIHFCFMHFLSNVFNFQIYNI